MELDPKDLRIELYPAGRSNWFAVPNGVQVTHIPSGLSCKCESDRSEHRNRFLALQELQKAVANWEPPAGPHPDDIAVDKFAAMMKDKLAKSREKGRSGWGNPEECSVEYLAKLLVDHVEKGDAIDVANIAMMLELRGASRKILTDAFRKKVDISVNTFVKSCLV